jgi:hypothetical protein
MTHQNFWMRPTPFNASLSPRRQARIAPPHQGGERRGVTRQRASAAGADGIGGTVRPCADGVSSAGSTDGCAASTSAKQAKAEEWGRPEQRR